jgi:L-histidine Nalpha-methyltransferase
MGQVNQIRMLEAQTADPKAAFALDVLLGLSGKPRSLPSRWFYDDEGSRLFQRIMATPEYYPTRCEAEILAASADRIAAQVGPGPLTVVELGAGDGTKTQLLLAALRRRGVAFRYVPVDISKGALESLAGTMQVAFPDLRFEGLVSDYFTALHWLAEQGDDRKLVMFLGSNIGNFNRAQSRVFARTMWNALRHDDLALIGFDLKKDVDVMLAAYNDHDGVTRAFNLNLLRRINRELGGGFDLAAFSHFGTYNVFTGAMESYLLSLRDQTIPIAALGTSFTFKPFEPIHVEYSFKYLDHDIHDMAGETGFSVVDMCRDQKGWFADALWRVDKDRAAADR